MNAVAISILITLIALVLFASQRWALLASMAGVLYLTQTQAIDVLGLQLYGVRLLEVAGFTRVILRKEYSFSKINRIDRVLLLFYCYLTVIFLLPGCPSFPATTLP